MEQKEQEFIKLVEKYKTVIYTVCYMFSNSKENVEDLFQDILLRLWNGYDKFRGDADVKTWIYRVSFNTCLNKRKKSKREGEHIPLSVDIDFFEDRINSLGLIDRAIILLWLEGMSYEEIGAIIGISIKNVSFQLHRIKEEIKKMTI